MEASEKIEFALTNISLLGRSQRGVSEELERALPILFTKLNLTKGQMLPSNACLAKKLGVSHITLRKALKALEQKGFILQAQGKGTYLNQNFFNDETLSGTVAIVLPHLVGGYAHMIDAMGKVFTQAGLKVQIGTGMARFI